MTIEIKRTSNLAHGIKLREHSLTVDEPTSAGGDDSGPTPTDLLAAALGSCTSITLLMYAKRKGWELGQIEVKVDHQSASAGNPASFEVQISIPADLEPDQLERLKVIAAKCPVHRALAGESVVTERFSTNYGPG